MHPRGGVLLENALRRRRSCSPLLLFLRYMIYLIYGMMVSYGAAALTDYRTHTGASVWTLQACTLQLYRVGHREKNNMMDVT